MMPSLPVIRNLGGCGGTLLSRLFSALPGTLVLSETNPRSVHLFAGHLNPLAQLRRWHPAHLDGLRNFDDAEIGHPEKFGEMLTRLHGNVLRGGGQLIVRDFNYADFIGVPFIWPVPFDSALDIAAAGRFTLRDIALVRSPGAQLASLRTHRALTQVLTAGVFLRGYETFVEVFRAAPRFTYEALVTAPAATLQAMCNALEVPFDAAALTGFATVTSVTGSSARLAEPVIAPPAVSQAVISATAELARLPGYHALCERLGYDPGSPGR